MSLSKGEKQLLRYTYDFSRDGGAQGAIALVPDANSIGDDYVISDIIVHVEEALSSGGSATVTLGNTTDDDGYLVDFFGDAGSDGDVIGLGALAGALVWDDTNDHRILYNVGSTADNQDLNLTVGTADLDGGKLSVYVEVMPLF